MYVIGLTGGVGSGKTAAAKELARLAQAKLLIADELGHLVMETGTNGYDKVVEAFGTEILDAAGKIDREKLAGFVFSEEEKRERLNQIIHPEVLAYLSDYIAQRKDREGILVLETALMFETGCDRLCDEVWYVFVPEQLRIERLKTGRGYTEKKCRAIMKRQLSEEDFMARSRCVIHNDGSIEKLRAQLLAQLARIRA